MRSTATTVSALGNVLLPRERIYTPDPDIEKDPRIRPRRNLRRLAVVLVLSVCLHAVLIMLLPKSDPPTLDASGPAQGPLQVTMAPAPSVDRSPPPLSEPAPSAPPRRTVIAAAKPSSVMPPVYVPPEPLPTRSRSQPETPPLDFAAALEARRAQRLAEDNFYAQQNADARNAERETTVGERAAAAFRRNAQTLGQSRDGTSGVFQIKSKGMRYAAFSFRGWTNDRSNAKSELIEVDAGQGGDVELAIVRRMIDLIRVHYQGNFNWESPRLGRVVVLSARKEDTAGLEAFLTKEFFS